MTKFDNENYTVGYGLWWSRALKTPVEPIGMYKGSPLFIINNDDDGLWYFCSPAINFSALVGEHFPDQLDAHRILSI